VAFECPYEGAVSEALVLDQVARLMAHKPARLVIADTIGAANPAAVQSMMQKLVDRYGPELLGCHFHDTRAMGLANVYAALLAGVRQFDASTGGLGGCPFAPGAKGNVATEDVAMLCESIGYTTNLNMPKLLDAVALLSEMIGAPQGGRAHTWLSKQCA
jgi:hydroxymethylglutaryl-CoA lyase